jgi:hypothetical protein
MHTTLPDGYGRRYLPLNDFIELCKSLDLDVDSNLLEFWERRGLLRPIFFVRLDSAYLEYLHSARYNTSDKNYSKIEFSIPNKWDKYEQALKAVNRWPSPFVGISLFHPFDKNPEKYRKVLALSRNGGYRNWDSYKRTIGELFAVPVKVETRIPIYHYWQAYIVSDILDSSEVKLLMDLRNDADLKALAHGKVPRRNIRRLSFPHGRFNSRQHFGNQARMLDNLSLYAQGIGNLRETQLVDVPIQDAFKPEALSIDFDRRQRYHTKLAQISARRSNLNESECLALISFMCKRYYDQKQKGRVSFALLIREDIANICDLTSISFGIDVSELTKRVGRVGPSFKNSLEDIFPDEQRESTDAARNFLTDLFKQPDIFPTGYVFTPEEVSEFLTYMETSGQTRFAWLLRQITKERFLGGSHSNSVLAVCLGELALMIEDLMKTLRAGTESGKSVGMLDQRMKMKDIFKTLFRGELWWSQFSQAYQITEVPTIADFGQAIRDNFLNRVFSTNRSWDGIQKTMLTGVFTRNVAAHAPSKLESIDRTIFHYVLRCVVVTLLIVWKHGKTKGLLDVEASSY